MGIFNKLKNVFSSSVINDSKKYEDGLKKTRNEFISELSKLSSKYKNINDDYFSDLEDILVMSDIGINTVLKFVDRLKDRVKSEKITSPEFLKEVIIDELFVMYVNNDVVNNKINFSNEGPTVILFVGVNGVGKTTSIGKIGSMLKSKGKKVMMVAADTFRAGAVSQLIEWGNKTDIKVVSSSSTDPSSVIFDALKEANDDDYDVVLVDTAGRLQNKDNLMRELEKMNRVIKKVIPDAPHETLLVIDASTGQNGIIQAKAFKEITNVTGIVLTKLDGTAKGGIVLAIRDEVNIPVKFVGLGEGINDLEYFDIEKYIYGLFKDL